VSPLGCPDPAFCAWRFRFAPHRVRLSAGSVIRSWKPRSTRPSVERELVGHGKSHGREITERGYPLCPLLSVECQSPKLVTRVRFLSPAPCLQQPNWLERRREVRAGIGPFARGHWQTPRAEFFVWPHAPASRPARNRPHPSYPPQPARGLRRVRLWFQERRPPNWRSAGSLYILALFSAPKYFYLG